jgi:hypothetical protein
MEFQRLRESQAYLNYFLWTSEVAYGYTLESAARQFPDATILASEAFANVTTAAWYPTNQGSHKYRDTVGSFLDHVRQNTVHVYRAVILFFASAFESYLTERVAVLERVAMLKLSRRNHSWGPYVKSLAIPELHSAHCPIQLRTVLCADICRQIRNCMVHPPFKIPTTLSDPEVNNWRVYLFREAKSAKWPEAHTDAKLNSALDWAFSRVIGEAERQVAQAKTAKKDLPVELFYTLFNFTNLDNLGFQIEEALIPVGSQILVKGRCDRKKDFVRRDDLIITRNTKPTVSVS